MLVFCGFKILSILLILSKMVFASTCYYIHYPFRVFRVFRGYITLPSSQL